MIDLTERPIWTVPQICAALQISAPTAYQEIRSGRLASFRVGRAIRVSARALQAFIDQQEATPAAAGE